MGTDDQDDDSRERTAKEIIDEGTQADLERWFGLPSVQAVVERGDQVKVSEDPEMVAVREKRAAAIAAADPAFLERHRVKWELAETFLKYKSEIEPIIDPTIASFDHEMLERQIGIAEPRDRELPQALLDDLRECTPQALLRDLHRPEFSFEKYFEVVDMTADQKLDIVEVVKTAMTTDWHIPGFDELPFRAGRQLNLDLAVTRSAPLTDLLPTLPNRRVKE